jgi:hypothetical protein
MSNELGALDNGRLAGNRLDGRRWVCIWIFFPAPLPEAHSDLQAGLTSARIYVICTTLIAASYGTSFVFGKISCYFGFIYWAAC